MVKSKMVAKSKMASTNLGHNFHAPPISIIWQNTKSKIAAMANFKMVHSKMANSGMADSKMVGKNLSGMAI